MSDVSASPAARPARFVAGPVRTQELPGALVVCAVIEARDCQIALRLRGDLRVSLPVLLDRHPAHAYASPSVS